MPTRARGSPLRLILPLALGLTLCATTAACARLGAGGQETASPSVSVSEMAQTVVDRTVAGQPHGLAKDAAFVETTFGEFSAIIPPASRPPSSVASPADRVLVVKIFGS